MEVATIQRGPEPGTLELAEDPAARAADPESRQPQVVAQAPLPLGSGGAGGVTVAALADGSEIVFGVPLEDNGTSKVVRRVVVLATMAATFYICHFISDLVRGRYSSGGSGNATSLWTAISTLMIELSIPACGYYGALHSNRQLTCCFCSCNLFVTIVTIMQFIRIELRIGEIDGQCEQEQDRQQRRTCEVWTSDGAEKYLTLVNLVVIICLGCLAFWFGNSLYQRLAQDFAVSLPAPAPVIGEVISLSSIGFAGVPVLVQPASAVGDSGAGDIGAEDMEAAFAEAAGDAPEADLEPADEQEETPRAAGAAPAEPVATPAAAASVESASSTLGVPSPSAGAPTEAEEASRGGAGASDEEAWRRLAPVAAVAGDQPEEVHDPSLDVDRT